jgi:carbonic anhydrase
MSSDSLTGKARGLALSTRFDLGVRGLVPQWRQMFSRKTLFPDIAAGVTVACVAIPLSLAIALASEVPPAVGLVTAIVASIIVPFFNGTPLAVAGPAAALAVLVGTIVEEHGLAGLTFIVLLVGAMQLLTGVLGLGRVIRLVPTSVVHGFTAGIGVIIILQQLPRAFGFPAPDEAHVLAVLLELPYRIPNADLWAVGFATFAAATTMFMPRWLPKAPAALIAVVLCTALSYLVGGTGAELGALPTGLPAPSFPGLPGTGFVSLLMDAFVVYAIASLETLLSSAAVDRLSKGQRHDPDQELIGQGLGNFAVSLFGGMPITGVIARSSTNVVAGARTRLSALVHAIVLLVAVYVAADVLAHIPVAALAGVLIAVGLRMASPSTLRGLLAISKTDAIVYGVTLVAIVVLDLLAGVQVGVGAAVLVAAVRLSRTRVSVTVQDGGPVHVAFRGPLTFLASIRIERVLERLAELELTAGVLVDLRQVHDIDASGAEAIQRITQDVEARGAKVAILGARQDVRETLVAAGEKAGVMPGLAATVADIAKIIPSASTRSHLTQGVQLLRRIHRKELEDLFAQFADGQQPHTLFVTCADSRVTPVMITGSDPGELFVVRNLGALLPPHDVSGMPSEIAAVEFAVRVLGVDNIVVCTHSNCGAMGILRSEQPPGNEGPLADWYEVAHRCAGTLSDTAERDDAAKLSARRQLDNLRSHAFVRDREQAGQLSLHAWFYDVATPDVFEWNDETEQFAPLTSAAE